MDSTNDEAHKTIVTAIRAVIPSEVKILFVCLTGSRGKGLASNESDYDVRVITQGSRNDYILKKVEETIKIQTKFRQGNVEYALEGQAVDLFKAFSYALETNPFMLDLLRGNTLYSEAPEVMDQLTLTYRQGFNPDTPIRAFEGMLYSYISKSMTKKFDSKEEQIAYHNEASVKALVECLYLVLEMRCLFEGEDILNYFSVDQVLGFAGDDKRFMESLIEKRREDRRQIVDIPDEFKTIIQTTRQQLAEFKENLLKKKGDPQLKQKKDDFRKRNEDFCLRLVCPNDS